jgi:hypothetical protein
MSVEYGHIREGGMCGKGRRKYESLRDRITILLTQ